jgi:hypothetical protein
MEEENEDFYITLLKYVSQQQRVGKTVHVAEVIAHVKSAHSDINVEGIKAVCFEALQYLPTGDPPVYSSGNYDERIRKETPHILTLEAYSHLLEHTELQEARKSSTDALKTAKWALVISATMAVFLIIVTAANLTIGAIGTDVVAIDVTQFGEVKQLISELKQVVESR